MFRAWSDLQNAGESLHEVVAGRGRPTAFGVYAIARFSHGLNRTGVWWQLVAQSFLAAEC